jgi:hypothetical protein
MAGLFPPRNAIAHVCLWPEAAQIHARLDVGFRG